MSRSSDDNLARHPVTSIHFHFRPACVLEPLRFVVRRSQSSQRARPHRSFEGEGPNSPAFRASSEGNHVAALGVDGLATVFRPEAQRLGGRLGRLVRSRDLLHDLEKLAVRAMKTSRQLKI